MNEPSLRAEISRLTAENDELRAKIEALREHTLDSNPALRTLHANAVAYLDAVAALQDARNGAPLSTSLAWLIRQGLPRTSREGSPVKNDDQVPADTLEAIRADALRAVQRAEVEDASLRSALAAAEARAVRAEQAIQRVEAFRHQMWTLDGPRHQPVSADFVVMSLDAALAGEDSTDEK